MFHRKGFIMLKESIKGYKELKSERSRFKLKLLKEIDNSYNKLIK